MNAKDGAISIKSLYSILEFAHAIPFPNAIIWNYWVPSKASFLERERGLLESSDQEGLWGETRSLVFSGSKG